MGIALHFTVFAVSGLLLMKVSGWFVTGAAGIASSLRLSKVFIGVTVVSIVTTTPELVTASIASAIGQPGLAVGNSLGSVIFNIGLVFPVAVLIRPVEVYPYEFTKILLLGASLLLFLVPASNGELSRFEAALCLVLLVLFLAYSYRTAVRERQLAQEVEEPEPGKLSLPRAAGLLIAGGAATVLLSRYGLVGSGLAIAEYFRVPPAMIGLTMMAAGTSLPELVTAVAASRKHHGEIVLGNCVGASILNLFWVLGIAGLIHPLAIDRQTLLFNTPVALAVTGALYVSGRSRRSFSLREGLLLLSIYAAYVIALFTLVY